jgi:hypothetical protein
VGNNVRFKLSGATTWSRNRGTAPALQPDGSTFVNGSLTDGYTTATYPSATAWPGDIGEYMDLMYGKTGSNYTNNLFSGSMDWVVSPTFFVNVTAGSLHLRHVPARPNWPATGRFATSGRRTRRTCRA